MEIINSQMAQQQTNLHCCNRLISKCRRYSYLDINGIEPPTLRQRTCSAVGGACSGIFPAALICGLAMAIAKSIEQAGGKVDYDLFLKVVIPIAALPIPALATLMFLHPHNFNAPYVPANQV